jgi:3-methyladenine DNA glycosylase AlkD
MITADEVMKRLRGARGVPGLRAVRRAISREIGDDPGPAVLALGREVVARREPAWIGYELILNHKSAFALLTPAIVEELGQGMNSWDTVDPFGMTIAGPAWKAGLVSDVTIARWAKSADRWWRRAALVATVPLNTRETVTGDARRTLAICDMLVADRDDMVVKAISWALRALSVRDRNAVEQFLEMYGTRIAARIRREVGNRLRTGLKTPRRR